MRPARIVGHIVLLCYLYITTCAFLFTVIRTPIFLTFPKRPILYSYGMIAPYQSAVAPHGQTVVECSGADGIWRIIDIGPFYPEMFGERNAREYFALFSYSGTEEDNRTQRMFYAHVLQRLFAERSIPCAHIRLSWDKWPTMTGAFDVLHLPAFTTRLPLYGFEN